MHKLLSSLTLLALVTGASTVHAQKSRIGLKAGFNISSFAGQDAPAEGSSRLGLCVGVVLHLPVNAIFSVQPEFLYSQKGADDQPFAISSTTVVKGHQRLQYFELPILAKFRSRSGLFAEAGPSLSYLLSGSGTFTVPNGPSITLDNRTTYEALELGYAVGAGFQAAKGLLLGGRYSHGFSGVAPAGSFRGISSVPRIYNQNFQFYVGCIFFGHDHARDEFAN